MFNVWNYCRSISTSAAAAKGSASLSGSDRTIGYSTAVFNVWNYFRSIPTSAAAAKGSASLSGSGRTIGNSTSVFLMFGIIFVPYLPGGHKEMSSILADQSGADP